MTTVATLTDAIKAKFEGGTSFTIDFNRILREGMQATLQNIAPKMLYREQPIYGGTIDGITVYYCPTEVAAPKGIYDNLKRLNYNFVAPNVFDYQISRHVDDRIFTICYKNGCRFILINAFGKSVLNTIDQLDNPLTVTGDMALTLNTFDFVSGAGAIQGIFSDTQVGLRGILVAKYVASTISFNAAGSQILDSANGFITAGFLVGQQFTVAGSAHNNVTFSIVSVSAGIIVVGQGVTTESAGASMTLQSLVPPLDISQSMFGTVVIPVKLIDPTIVASIVFKLKTDSGDYYTLTASTAFSYLIQGWNIVRINMAEAIATGAPVQTNIVAWELDITMQAGKSQLVIVDRLGIANTSLYNLQFTSGLAFIDATTGQRKVEPSNPLDLIDLLDEEIEILKYECCRIVLQEASLNMTNSPETTKFDTELARKYQLYYEKNPSDEQPTSYNNLPEIDRTIPLGNILPR